MPLPCWVLIKPAPPTLPPMFVRSVDMPDSDRQGLKVTYTPYRLEAKVYINPQEAQRDAMMSNTIMMLG